MASPPNAPTESVGSFELIRETPFPTLGITLDEFRHSTTGTRHVHLASADPVNALMVGVLTPPVNNSGLTHVLEHLLLCGGRGFPARPAFFAMRARSACLTMNAHASDDCTSYHFATAHRQDFNNLLEVYLDCLFRPRLDPLDFLQEGHRIEYTSDGGVTATRRRRGVVLSEMLGAMGLASTRLEVALKRHLFPGSAYRFNTGGNPNEIVELELDNILAYHDRYYHPANALFLSSGNLPPEEHQRRIEDIALAAWGSRPARPLDQRMMEVHEFSAPLQVTEPIAASEVGQFAVAWLLGDRTSLDAVMEARLLESLLLSSATGIARSVITAERFRGRLSAASGLALSRRRMSLCIAVESADPSEAEIAEQTILDTVESALHDGIPSTLVSAALDSMERSVREVGSARYPYSLDHLARLLLPVLHGGNAAEHFNPLPALKRLRAAVHEPGQLARRIEQRLLRNPHRLCLVLLPRAGIPRGDHIPSLPRNPESPAADAATHLADDNQADSLPILSLDDLQVPREPTDPPAQQLRAVTLYRRNRPTNKMVHLRLAIRTPALEPKLAEALPLYVGILDQLANGHMQRVWRAIDATRVCNGVDVRLAVQAAPRDPAHAVVALSLGASTLAHQGQALFDLLQELLDHDMDFEPRTLQITLQQYRVALRERLFSRGHDAAQCAAGSALSATAALVDRFEGLSALTRLSNLLDEDRRMRRLPELALRLKELSSRLQHCHRYVLEVRDTNAELATARAGEQRLQMGDDEARDAYVWRPHLQPLPALRGYVIATSAGFVGRAVASVVPGHPDAPALAVLGAKLTNGMLHQRIRERGGAYGTGAGYNLCSGVFQLFSYRDPSPTDTLLVFDEAMDWLARTPTTGRALQQAKLAVIRQLDHSTSPAEAVSSDFTRDVVGVTRPQRTLFRDAVLALTAKQMQRAFTTHLRDATPASIVMASASTLAGMPTGE